MSVITNGPATSPGPFEGPEKLLEVWFAPSPDRLPEAGPSTPLTRRPRGGEDEHQSWRGLRRVPREVWEEMLDIVKCKVLSVVEGEELDAYLLSESSLFVAPHLVILKTCGTTLNLLGLYRIIEIARQYCGFHNVWRCFYSRKSFFFPERQAGPHRDWQQEVQFLDSVFGTTGSAYIVGPMNRDHWLLYLTSPNSQPLLPGDSALTSTYVPSLPSPGQYDSSSLQDTTLEILMTHLSPEARAPFFASIPAEGVSASIDGRAEGVLVSQKLGIDKIFEGETTLDSFGFDPCGYSANGVVGTGMSMSTDGSSSDGGYFTIHVTPEEGWSYASFECNVPLPPDPSGAYSPNWKAGPASQRRPGLSKLIRQVVDIFQPSRLSITLFVSTPAAGSGDAATSIGSSDAEQRAWKAFGADLLGRGYERKDRIGYEFDGYDLVFACFEKRGWTEPPRQHHTISLEPQ